ncbi:MAG: aldo/keto reductase [Verrucomicrobiales bacterium]|nr:aldo/keto reductase [Verrucomicrobiales bacterium]
MAGMKNDLTRRELLQLGGAAATELIATALASQVKGQPATSPDSPSPLPLIPGAPGQIPRRALGKTGATISILGMGGHHLADPKSFDDAAAMVHEALDAGLNFFDNCWEYHNGRSEAWLGAALHGRRDQAFVMTKVCTHGREGKLGLRMLEQSLRRLQTDHLDLWQIHAISYDNDPDLAYAKGGIIEALDHAKKQGKVRFVGFTGHRDPSFHLRMIELGYPFDTVQMPLNPFDASFFSFEQQVLPEALRRGIGVLGMKSMGGTAYAVKAGVVKPDELLRYALSLPASTTISGMDSLEVVRKNLETARNFQPMKREEMNALRERCRQAAADGRYEPYKVSLLYDNPETRQPHGYPVDPHEKEVKEMLEDLVARPGTDTTDSPQGNTP